MKKIIGFILSFCLSLIVNAEIPSPLKVKASNCDIGSSHGELVLLPSQHIDVAIDVLNIINPIAQLILQTDIGDMESHFIYALQKRVDIPIDVSPQNLTATNQFNLNIMSKINAVDLNALKVKYKHIQVLTVVVEPEVLDIDKLSAKDLKFLKDNKIDINIVCNSMIPLPDRLLELSKLESIDKKDKPTLSGKVIQEGESYEFAVRRPDRGHISMLMPLAQKQEIDEFAEKAVANLVVGGDIDALDDGLVFMGVVAKLKDVIMPGQSFLTKA